jgi:hypothetical protein
LFIQGVEFLFDTILQSLIFVGKELRFGKQYAPQRHLENLFAPQAFVQTITYILILDS